MINLKGQLEIKHIMKWIRKKCFYASTSIESEIDFEKFKNDNDVSVVGFFKVYSIWSKTFKIEI